MHDESVAGKSLAATRDVSVRAGLLKSPIGSTRLLPSLSWQTESGWKSREFGELMAARLMSARRW